MGVDIQKELSDADWGILRGGGGGDRISTYMVDLQDDPTLFGRLLE